MRDITAQKAIVDVLQWRRWQKGLWLGLLALFTLLWLMPAQGNAQTNLDVDSPAVRTLKGSMRGRFAQLKPLFESGAIGLAADGTVVLRDASSVEMAQRGQVNSLLAAENNDRAALYREIARANDHPEWEADIRKTFADRWIEHAPAGWWVQSGGGWKKK